MTEPEVPARPSYGPATRDRPDIKAAFHWFRQMPELPDGDRRLLAVIGEDELVLGAFDIWLEADAGWHTLIVTDRRLLRAVGKPEPAVYEMPLGTVIGVSKQETKDDLVRVKIVDRTGHYSVWVRSDVWYYRFLDMLWWARSRLPLSPAPSPEPVRGSEIEGQFEAYTALRAQIDAGTVPESEMGARMAAVFGVAAADPPAEPGWSGM
ncbi:hypothetical protein GCM10009551_067740 [Nocardiopsis tropica]|uniref:hypothetical protein n=1 Tax=Tsukamurella strandjordii TaxID=147577 RepID=UPI0031E18421